MKEVMMWDDYLELDAIVVNLDQDTEDAVDKKILENDLEFIIYKIDVPYWEDILCVKEHWQPNSYRKVGETGKFDACMVEFGTLGPLLLAMTKSAFKKKWAKFVEEREENNMDIEFISDGDVEFPEELKQQIVQKLKNERTK